MSKVETLDNVAKGSFAATILTGLSGSGIENFPFSGGGYIYAADIIADSPRLIRGHDLNTLINPFGGFDTYKPTLYFAQNGLPEAVWHATYHSYTFSQGLGVLGGDLTLALLATAGVTKLLSVAGRRLSRSSGK